MAEFKRSRLKTKIEEQSTRSTIFLGLLSVAVVVGVLVFGLPLLIKLSVFLGDIKNKKGGEMVEKVLPPLPPRMVVPYEATNSARIDIFGLAEPEATVELLKNDVPVETVMVSSEGEFRFERVDLEMGNNSFLARAMTDKGGSSDLSVPLEIVYDNELPQIEMVNPSEEKLKVDYADFDVIGKTERGISVLINGRIAVVDDEGKFKLKVQLVPGKNEIEVVARDLAGNEEKKKIEIEYDF